MWTTAPIWLALIVALMLLRAGSFAHPPEWDCGMYAVVANELNHGGRLYRDVWDIKPPGIFATYALAQHFFGYSQACLYALSVLSAAASLTGIWLVGSALSRNAGLWAAVFWCAVCFDPGTGAYLPNCEAFMNAALVLGWAALWHAGEGSAAGGKQAVAPLTAAGLLFAVATIYKQVSIAPVAAVTLAHVLFPPPGVSRRHAMGQALIVAILIVGAWAALFGWFAATDRGPLFWRTIVVSPRAYGGDLSDNLLDVLRPAFWSKAPLLPLLPLAALSALGIAAIGRRRISGLPAEVTRRRRWAAQWGAMLAGVLLAAALPGQQHLHYLQLLLPVLALGAGAGAQSLAGWGRDRTPRAAVRAVPALAALLAFWPQVRWLRLDPTRRTETHYGALYLRVREDFLTATASLPTDQLVYVWGEETWLYPVSGRRCPYAAVWRLHALSGPMAPHLTARTLAQLQARPPAMIAAFGGLGPQEHPISRWMGRHYELVSDPAVSPLQFFVPRRPRS